MNELFGIQTNDLLLGLLIICALSGLVLTVIALRSRVMFHIGVRNIPRRPTNTVLICLGLMLASTIFSASFATGDTLTHSIRSEGVSGLGEVDVMVMGRGTTFGAFQSQFEGSSLSEYFSEDEVNTVAGALAGLAEDGIVEGIAPAVLETKPVMSPETRLFEPAVAVLGLDPDTIGAFTPVKDKHGNELSLADLEISEELSAYINTTLAEKLDVSVGEVIDVSFRTDPTPVIVAGVYESGGNPTTFTPDSAGSLIIPKSRLQSELGTDEINFVLITARGGSIDGAQHTDAIVDALKPVLAGTGLKAEPVKQDALDAADESGAVFSTIFVVMGSFSIIAGILLIFLIFIMLAAERKQELGIARAVGAQRGHIVQMFTFEGVLYALLASAVGSAFGILISWGMIQVMSAAFKEMGFAITFDFTLRSIVIAYTLGVFLTLIVVVIAAWRVSRLNIVAAIRDIPESRTARTRSIMRIIFTIGIWLMPFLGLAMAFLGIAQKSWTPYSIGISLAIIGVTMIGRRFGFPDRPAFTFAGVAILIFWLLPVRVHPHGEEMAGGFDTFVLTGVMLVISSTWIVMYNSDLLLSGLMSLFGRFRAVRPMVKTAVAYPLANRFRTGMALSMFSLIIFTLVMMSSVIASFNRVLDDTERVAGGFHIRAEVLNRDNTISDIHSALAKADGVNPDDFTNIAGFSMAFVGMKDVREDSGEAAPPEDISFGEDSEWKLFPLVGMDKNFTLSDPYRFQLTLRKYATSADVWQAVANDPTLAVISMAMAPSRSGGQMGTQEIELTIGEGDFALEDKFIPEGVYVDVVNPNTGAYMRLQVVGVIDAMAGPVYAPGVGVSQETLNHLGYTDPRFADPVSYRFRLRPDLVDDAPEIAKALEVAFFENGMDAESMEKEIKDWGRINQMFWNLSIAFMGLGLIVGIAALGVIAARAVVERRQQIGMLRAIGFRQGMVQFTFLLESSFVALLGIGVGVGLGVGTSLLFMGESGIEGMVPVIPWAQILLIAAVAYLASLTTTFIPAYRAARIYPAEALRYE